jgi:UDPglucose 6-dehydrogenase
MVAHLVTDAGHCPSDTGRRHRAGFDPQGMEQTSSALLSDVIYCRDALDAAAGGDAWVLITEWNEFRALSPAQLAAVCGRIVVDLRNAYEPVAMHQAGFNYHGVGRQAQA